MSWLSRTAGKVGGAVSGAVSSVAGTVKAGVDQAGRTSIGGVKVGQAARDWVVRPAIATGAAGVTGGASIWAGQKAGGAASQTFGVAPAVRGYATGAAVGGAIALAPALAPAAIKAGVPLAIGAGVRAVTPGKAERPPVNQPTGGEPVSTTSGPVAGPSFLARLLEFAFPR